MSYKVTTPDGKTRVYEDIHQAVSESPDGSTITNTEPGAEYKVRK